MERHASRAVMITAAFIVLIAAAITAAVFNTPFARSTVDYFSFFAGLVLVADGFYKIRRYADEPYFPNQFIRVLRIIFGTCIFTIHFMQYLYGT